MTRREHPRKDLRDLFAKKAEEGDGSYAIAYAILDLADELQSRIKSIETEMGKFRKK